MLYLIQSSQFLKIGYSSDISGRFKDYDTHNPDYVLIATRSGNYKSETIFHNLLYNYKVNNTEWLTYDKFIIDSFINLKLESLTNIPDQVFIHVDSFPEVIGFEKISKSSNFYMTFLDYIGPLYQLKSDSLKNLLTYLCDKAEFNTGKVQLTTSGRKQLCSDLSISNNTLTNYLGKLKKLNLISGKDGDFIINPQIFWKGDIKSRSQILEKEEIKLSFKLG